MLQELANGTVLAGRVQAGSVDTEPVQVSTSLDYVNVRLGTELTFADIEEVFAKLGFGLTGDADKFTVSAVSYTHLKILLSRMKRLLSARLTT